MYSCITEIFDIADVSCTLFGRKIIIKKNIASDYNLPIRFEH